MEMTVELFDSIINTSQDCVFWKDKERRFLGVWLRADRRLQKYCKTTCNQTATAAEKHQKGC